MATRTVSNVPVSERAKKQQASEWLLHRRLHDLVHPKVAGFRGCFGLSLVVDVTTNDSWKNVSGSRLMLPVDTVKWASLVDMPIGRFSHQKPRDTHWCSTRPTSFVCGMPTITNQANAWDFRLIPSDNCQNDDVLAPARYPQLNRVFMGLEWTMTSYAMRTRKEWKPAVDGIGKLLAHVEQDVADSALAAMYRPHSSVVAWMPRFYLAFRQEVAGQLFDVATMRGQYFSTSLKYAFSKSVPSLAYKAPFDGHVTKIEPSSHYGIPTQTVTLLSAHGEQIRVVFSSCCTLMQPGTQFSAGAVIGSEDRLLQNCFRPGFDTTKARWFDVWNIVADACGDDLPAVVRLWYERQFVNMMPGYVHVQSALASVAAFGYAVDEYAQLDVGHCGDYWDDFSESFIFPGIYVQHVEDIVGDFPGDIAYDFTPKDDRFISNVSW